VVAEINDRRLASITAATDAFNDAVPDIDALIGVVAEHISRASGDFCSVVLLSPDGRQIEPVAAYHTDPMIMEDARQFVGVAMDLEAAAGVPPTPRRGSLEVGGETKLLRVGPRRNYPRISQACCSTPLA
jgi:hypothetical protein